MHGCDLQMKFKKLSCDKPKRFSKLSDRCSKYYWIILMGGLGQDITSDFTVLLEIYLKTGPFGAKISYLLMFHLGYK